MSKVQPNSAIPPQIEAKLCLLVKACENHNNTEEKIIKSTSMQLNKLLSKFQKEDRETSLCLKYIMADLCLLYYKQFQDQKYENQINTYTSILNDSQNHLQTLLQSRIEDSVNSNAFEEEEEKEFDLGLASKRFYKKFYLLVKECQQRVHLISFEEQLERVNYLISGIEIEDNNAFGYFNYLVSVRCFLFFQNLNQTNNNNNQPFLNFMNEHYQNKQQYLSRFEQQISNLNQRIQSDSTIPYDSQLQANSQQGLNSTNQTRPFFSQQSQWIELVDQLNYQQINNSVNSDIDQQDSVVSSFSLVSQDGPISARRFEILYQDAINLQREDEDNNNNINNMQSRIDINQNIDTVATIADYYDKSGSTHVVGDLANGAGRIVATLATQTGRVLQNHQLQKVLMLPTSAGSLFAKSANIGDLALCSVGWLNVVITTGIAAIEASYVCYKYFKMRKACNEDKEKIAKCKESFKKQLAALGVKTASTFGITTGCMIAGGAIGSVVPVIGTFVGTIIGSVVGALLSICVDKFLWNSVFFNEKKLLEESERELGLHDFQKNNNGKKYTKQDLEVSYRAQALSKHPDKFQTEELKNQAKANFLKVQFAREYIKKHFHWDNPPQQ